jgi:hypothetical protein
MDMTQSAPFCPATDEAMVPGLEAQVQFLHSECHVCVTATAGGILMQRGALCRYALMSAFRAYVDENAALCSKTDSRCSRAELAPNEVSIMLRFTLQQCLQWSLLDCRHQCVARTAASTLAQLQPALLYVHKCRKQ